MKRKTKNLLASAKTLMQYKFALTSQNAFLCGKEATQADEHV